MPLGNCARCGKLFNRLSRPICPDCAKEEERQAEAVMAFVRENPSAAIDEISEATGVDSKLVLRLIRDDRLRAASAYTITCNCRACGVPISDGQYCASCMRKFGRAFANTGLGTGKDEGCRRAPDGADRTGPARMAVPERRRQGKKP